MPSPCKRYTGFQLLPLKKKKNTGSRQVAGLRDLGRGAIMVSNRASKEASHTIREVSKYIKHIIAEQFGEKERKDKRLRSALKTSGQGFRQFLYPPRHSVS